MTNTSRNRTLSQQIRFNRFVPTAPVLALVLIGVFANGNVQANTWNPPQLLKHNININFSGFNAVNTDVAIDAKGNSVVVWIDQTNGQVMAKSFGNTGRWSTETVIDPALGSSFPQVEMSAAGNATAIWYNASGLWTSDRPAGGKWFQPTLLVTVSNLTPYTPQTKIAMNNAGDTLLSWSNRSSVMAMRRAANGTWGFPVEIAATSIPYHDVGMKDIAINDRGDALIAWEFNSRHPHGYLVSSTLNVARQTPAGTVWQQSGKIADTAVYGNALSRKLLLDEQGHAGVVYFPAGSAGNDYKISRQPLQGQAWSKGQPVPTGCGFCKILNGINSDGAGNITVMASRNFYLNPKKNGSISLNGSLTDPTWTIPTPIPNILTVNQALTFDVGLRGDASAGWFASEPLTGKYLFKTASRLGAKGVWHQDSSFSVDTGNYGQINLAVLDVKVNPSGKTVILYSWGGYDSTFTLAESNLFAVVYN